MEKQLQPKLQSFDFFKKRKEKSDTLDKFLVACFCVGVLYVTTACVSIGKFSEDITKSKLDKEKFSQIVKNNVKDLNTSLKNKDWSNAQYELMRLNEVSSSQINKEVVSVLSDYAQKNFTSKPYSNEFSLLVTSYLTYMQIKPMKEKQNITKLENNFVFTVSNESAKSLIDTQANSYKLDIAEIKEKSAILLKGLKDNTELKSRLINNFEIM